MSFPLALPPVSRVAIIGGGGPSGISALHQLLEHGVKPDQIRSYEARSTVGGVWIYDETPGACRVEWRQDGRASVRTEGEIANPHQNGPTAVYDNLRTNLQKDVMAFRDVPFPPHIPVFPSHRQIVDYLKLVVETRGIDSFIQFSTLVRRVYHTPDADAAHRWTVETTRTLADGTTRDATETFSHVIVTNGHYNEPFVPQIPGLRSWKGQLLHSRWWRNASQHRDKNVLVVGSRASGSDITRELAMDDLSHPETTRKIYQSVRVSMAHPNGGDGLWDDTMPWVAKIEVTAEIARIEGHLFHLVDGSVISNVDTLIFATGYVYSDAPFITHPVTPALSPSEPGMLQGGGVKSVNLNITDSFYAPDPTLAFIGLHYLVAPFPLSETIARFIAHCYRHAVIPPLKPLLRNSDAPDDVKIGNPQEYTNQDNLLEAIGEGGDGSQGWARYPQRLRDLRSRALEQRKNHLGY